MTSMKLQIVSDLHREFGDPVVIENAGADVLILGGDITSSRNFKSDVPFFEEMADQFEHVIYYLGNHEFYHGDFRDTPKMIKDGLCHINNLYLLNNEHVLLNGCAIWGGTLWTDCNGQDKASVAAIERGLSDYRLIRNDGKKLTVRDTIKAHKQALESLQIFLTSFPDFPCIVATHHSPSFRSVHPRYKDDYHINGAFHSGLDNIMARYQNIPLWVHGHTHDSMKYMLYNTLVMANPAGYPHRMRNAISRENENFSPNLMIEV